MKAIDIRHLQKIDEVFTPSAPISNPHRLFGRQNELNWLIENIVTSGRHMLLLGERGVGKTSLVEVANEILIKNKVNKKILHFSCDGEATYREIFGHFLAQADLLNNPIVKLKKKTTKMAAKGKVPTLAEGELSSTSEESTEFCKLIESSLSAYQVISPFFKKEFLLVIDEFDNITDEKTKKFIVSTIKTLSDRNSMTKMLIIGIGSSMSELIGKHESINRCINDLKLSRLNDNDIRELIRTGADLLEFSIEEPVLSVVTQTTCGLPHFAHLLGAEIAKVVFRMRLRTVALDNYKIALGNAMRGVLNYIKDAYSDSIPTEAIKIRDEITDGVDTTTKIPIIVSPELIELVIWGAALSKKNTCRDISLIASQLLDFKLQLLKNQSGQYDQKYDTLFNISDISENDIEMVRLAMQLHGNKIIEFYTENNIEFIHPYYRAYAFMKASDFVGAENIGSLLT